MRAVIVCFCLFVASLVRAHSKNAPGGPGKLAELDTFNAAVDWGKRYAPAEPQQIHLGMLTDGRAFRVQFSTATPLKRAVFQYWSAVEGESGTSIKSTHDLEDVIAGRAL